MSFGNTTSGMTRSPNLSTTSHTKPMGASSAASFTNNFSRKAAMTGSSSITGKRSGSSSTKMKLRMQSGVLGREGVKQFNRARGTRGAGNGLAVAGAVVGACAATMLAVGAILDVSVIGTIPGLVITGIGALLGVAGGAMSKKGAEKMAKAQAKQENASAIAQATMESSNQAAIAYNSTANEEPKKKKQSAATSLEQAAQGNNLTTDTAVA